MFCLHMSALVIGVDCVDELFAFEKTVGIISGLVLCKDGEDPNKCCSL